MRVDLGLLILRVGVGLMMVAAHGYGKLAGLLAGNTGFPDPIGIGPVAGKLLATFAEFFCGLAVVVGFKTRWAAVPLVITMLVAALIHHIDDPWGKKEFALLYAVPFLVLVFTGAGRFSIDGLMGDRRRRR